MSETPRSSTENTSENRPSRRDVAKAAAYVVPAVVTLSVAPALAQRASFPVVTSKP